MLGNHKGMGKRMMFDILKMEIYPEIIVNMLKTIANINRPTMEKLFEVYAWPFPDEFEPIWQAFQVSPYHGLCKLDHENLRRIFGYAQLMEAQSWKRKH